jgi:hypothetical protein
MLRWRGWRIRLKGVAEVEFGCDFGGGHEFEGDLGGDVGRGQVKVSGGLGAIWRARCDLEG